MNKYHYTECGLPNVWLENGFVVRETPYGKAVAVHDVEGLHLALAKSICSKKGVLTGAELRFLRGILGLSQAGLGKLLDRTEQSVSLWERKNSVPRVANMHVRTLALAKVDGDTTVRQLLERVNTVERLVNQMVVAKSSKTKGWQAITRAESGTKQQSNSHLEAVA